MVPRWLWWAALAMLVAVAMGGLVGALLLATGAAEAPRAGPLQWSLTADATGCLDVAALDLPPLSPPATVELTAARLPLADAFAAWGLWLMAADAVFRWEVLPPGYFRHQGQTFPFPSVSDGPNDLRLDLADGMYRLWLNRERAAEGAIPDGALNGPLPWGLLRDEGICWRRLALYGPN